ncbi:glutathione S-transferase family protein [Marinomonas rhizomae]|uniref:Glutathione S-transferase n=1 Tax=Marinomonas rhizomae TaxID=491948 RepID=A0A366JDL4_9GAMM|nr:glutathione S-transferase family protein [Marinomonas rhizomae]RBP85083.1 glutathione S-transferase [Marinomonas rhizomae]RNF76194.1 glutathione S-transferase family protein [Marinomonas rhizomae]
MSNIHDNIARNNGTITLYHAPQTRGTGVLVLLEELGVPYEMKVLNFKAGENQQPEFLAINPLGKFPTLVHNGTVVTEQVACYLYLADLFPEKGLAPALNDPKRGAYLRWMAYQGSSFEPALIDKAFNRSPVEATQLSYGSFDKMLKTLFDQIAKGPYLLGEQLYAVDILWGISLKWCRMFGLITTNPVVDAYIDRVISRPAFIKAEQQDQALLLAQESE